MDITKIKYSIRIVYSKEDKCYIAWSSELSKGCNAFGDSYENVIKKLQIIIPNYITCTKEKIKATDFNDLKYCCIKDDIKYFDNIWKAFELPLPKGRGFLFQ